MCEGVADLFTSLMKPENMELAGAAMKSAGSLASGVGGKKMFDYQAAQAIADGEAERQLGEVKASKLRKLGGVVKSEALAAQGASGADVNSRTAMEVRAHIDRSAEEDALTEIYAGQARQRSAQATAALLKRQGRNAMITGIAGAGSSLLAGAGKSMEVKEAGDRWLRRREADYTSQRQYSLTGQFED